MASVSLMFRLLSLHQAVIVQLPVCPEFWWGLASRMERRLSWSTCFNSIFLSAFADLIIRSISDNACTGAHIDFNKFVPKAVKNSSIIIKSLLLNM